MKTITLLTLSLLCSFNLLQAQSAFSGTVIDDQRSPVFFATVALYNQADSSFVQSASSDDEGKFEIKKIKDGDYYLEVSMLGFQKSIQTLQFPTDNGKNLRFELNSDAEVLSTVEVTATKPLLEQKSDRMIVNVENNITSLGTNLMEVMKKVPGMIVTGDRIRMAGQSNMTILINGRSTKYMDIQSLMKDIPGDNIKKIEVIHQPGAEFPAEGTGPILNIVLKSNKLFGTNGRINIGAAKGENWRHRESISLSHYQGSVNVNASTGFWRNAWYDNLVLTRVVDGDVYEQDSYDPGFSRGWRANLGVDWNITENQRVGVSSRYVDSRTDNLIENTTEVNFADDTATDWMLLTENKEDRTWRLFTLNPYYQFDIDSLGQKLTFDVNYIDIANDGIDVLSTEELNVGQKFFGQQNLRDGATQFWTSQLDYTYPINEQWKAQIGAKYSDANLDNDLENRKEQASGEWLIDQGSSNRFIFDERIMAGYGKLSFDLEKWNGTFGLRYENSDSEGYSVTLDSLIQRPISKFFPSASIGRKITKDLVASVAYSYRIDRPRYSNLNPFRYFLDQYTFQAGNPNLAPALTHSTKFNLAYQGQPFFNIEYKHTNDAMVEVTDQDDAAGTSNKTTVNLDNFKVFNVSLFFPLDFIPGITGYGGMIANRNQYDSPYLDEQFQATKWDYTGFLQANFKLPWEMNAEISGWYNSGGQEGLINSSWLYGVDMGVRKTFLDDRLTVSAGVDNVLARYFTGDVVYSNMNIDIYNRWDGPVVNMQVSYKFGNQHMKQKKSHKSSASDELNRAN